MFTSIFNIISEIVVSLAGVTVGLIGNSLYTYNDIYLADYDFNLVLFSENPILSMTLDNFLFLFFTIFYAMFFIVLLYKATKKFITLVFGVFKL